MRISVSAFSQYEGHAFSDSRCVFDALRAIVVDGLGLRATARVKRRLPFHLAVGDAFRIAFHLLRDYILQSVQFSIQS